MSTYYGFIITRGGWELLAEAASGNGEKLVLDYVLFGEGKQAENTEADNPALFTHLAKTVAEGKLSEPVIEEVANPDGEIIQKTVSFVCEYSSDYTGEDQINPSGVGFPYSVTRDFYLREFGIFAHVEHDEDGHTVKGPTKMIYYATLESMPHPVTTYAKGAIDVRRYPVSLTISANTEVTLNQLPLAFVTHEEMKTYAKVVCKPIFLAEAQEYVDDVHNFDPEAHPDIRALVAGNTSQINDIWALIGGNALSYRHSFFANDSFELIHGIRNSVSGRIEF